MMVHYHHHSQAVHSMPKQEEKNLLADNKYHSLCKFHPPVLAFPLYSLQKMFIQTKIYPKIQKGNINFLQELLNYPKLDRACEKEIKYS
jgi:hypothetical protein